MSDLPVSQAEAKPSPSDLITDVIAPLASEVAASTVTGHPADCRCRPCWAVRTGFDIGYASGMAAGVASGRAQAAADIRAAVAIVGELPAGAEKSMEGQLAVVLLAEWENAAKIAAGGAEGDQSGPDTTATD